MSEQNKKPRLGIFGKASVAPTVKIIKPMGAAANAATLYTMVAQMLPECVLKSTRSVRFAMSIMSKAESGSIKSFRPEGKVPGPPFTFAYPTISDGKARRSASKFSFQGYIELPNGGPETGSMGEVLVEAPASKVFGASIYPEAEEKTVSKKDSALATTSIGAAWGPIEFAKVALVTNTEAFFSSPRFQQALEMAATDTSFGPANTNCWAVSKSRQNGIQMINSQPVRLYNESFNRFVLVTNPPTGSKFGAQITDVQGGTLTDRGTTRPYKLTLTMAGNTAKSKTVTMWPSDVSVLIGDAEDVVECLKTETLVLLIAGSMTDTDGVEYVVRAASRAIDEDDFLSFDSNVFKSLFNDVAHNATLAKSAASKISYEHSIKAILDAGGSVSISAQRASDIESLLLHKGAAIGLVREYAKAQTVEDEDTKAIVESVASASDELVAEAIEALDKSAGTCTSLASTRDKIIEGLEAAPETEIDIDKMKIAIVAVNAFESMDKNEAAKLQPMVKRSVKEKSEVGEASASDFVGESDDEDLCEGL